MKPKITTTPFFKTGEEAVAFQDEYPNAIFVYGSNLSGIHGAGAARHALEWWGAIYGVGIVGIIGRSCAIPTKNEIVDTLPLDHIQIYLEVFQRIARLHPEKMFLLTPIGCGLAGYKPEQIKAILPVFTENVILPKEFQ